MRTRCARAGVTGARWALLVLLLLILASPALATGPKFPPLTGRVVDDAGVLNAYTRGELTLMLADHERATGEQVVVVTLHSLQGYTIEDYGYQLGRYWGIGQKGANNGTLLIVAPKEHKVRIEVGYGLEGELTDAISATIIQNNILPSFKRGDFNAGLLAGTTSILQVLGGNPISPEPPAKPIPFWSAPWQAYVGLVVWFLGFFGAWGFFLVSWFRHRHDRHNWMTYGGGGWSGGWSSRSSGGGSSGGGGGGGGFSGGGGSFGGGGASGSW